MQTRKEDLVTAHPVESKLLKQGQCSLFVSQPCLHIRSVNLSGRGPGHEIFRKFPSNFHVPLGPTV